MSENDENKIVLERHIELEIELMINHELFNRGVICQDVYEEVMAMLLRKIQKVSIL